MNRNNDLSENLKYNVPDFPILTSDEYLSELPTFCELIHWHNDLEFILVTHGTLDFFINDKIIHLHENNGLCVNSNRLHYGFSETKSEVLFKMVIASPDLVRNNYNNSIIDSVICEQNADYFLFSKNQIIWNVLERIHEINKQKRKNYELELQSELCSVLWQLKMTDTMYTEHGSENIIALKNMINYIHEHYCEKISVREIALSGTVCRNKCYQIFEYSMKMTPMHYLTHYRIQKSTDMLRYGISIARTAHDCGFCSQSHFTDVFREISGMTPSKYIEHIKSEGPGQPESPVDPAESKSLQK